MTSGYYRFPTIHDNTIIFVSEDDLWQIDLADDNPSAHRLTSNLGAVTYPALSPDGTQLAFVGREEGAPEVYVMPAEGGPAQRLTFQSSNPRVLGWNRAGTHVVFSTNYGQNISREYALFQIAADAPNGEAEPLNLGPARSVAFGPDGASGQPIVLGRNTGELAYWKRYRGGTAGRLWIDENGDGDFAPLLHDLEGNVAAPMWVSPAGEQGAAQDGESRLFFISDHEGIGNLYSCTPSGGTKIEDLRRHTDHEDYYARNPATDGRRIVYHAGADLYVFDPATDESRAVDVGYRSPRVQRNRKFVRAARYLDDVRLHPSGKALTLTTRGKMFSFFNHEGPVLQVGRRDGVRYRLADWLQDGDRAVAISDELGEETLEIHSTDDNGLPEIQRLAELDIGRVDSLLVSPVADKVAVTNHRHELLVVDLESGALTTVDRSDHRPIGGFDWSPDGRWLAYGFAPNARTMEIRLADLDGAGELGEQGSRGAGKQASKGAGENEDSQVAIRTITRPVLRDVSPAFDPEGKYLYFLSYREFNPVFDGLHFELGFPWGMRPYLVTLQSDLPNPFLPQPDFDDDEKESDSSDEDDGDEDGVDDADDDVGDDNDDIADEGDEDDGAADESTKDGDAVTLSAAEETGEEITNPVEALPLVGDGGKLNGEKQKKAKDKIKPTQIDFEGIERRVLAFPVADGRYGQIVAIPGKALFTLMPIQGQLDPNMDEEEEEETSGELRAYDFKTYRNEMLMDNVNWFDVSRNRKKLIYGVDHRLRVIDAGEKAPSSSGGPRRSGWIDLSRVKVSIDPQSEWEQMFREAWRLQRDNFWTENMSQVDWQTVYQRYFPLIERVSTRSEFSDLMWEMQGELGTSHAYEMGGDYRARPHYVQGFLGATLELVRSENGDGADDGNNVVGYRVVDLVRGDAWDTSATSPLTAPGVDVKIGDVITAVNGQPVDARTSPAQLLVNQAGEEVLLAVKRAGERGSKGAEEQASRGAREQGSRGTVESSEKQSSPAQSVIVKTLATEAPARYRQWVDANRARVHEASDGRVGYLHIPDMGAQGFAEFHRGYLAEINRDGLVIDVRYNGGGFVSQLLLEKLARRRIGYDFTRYGSPDPFPRESAAGPLVALTNEQAGSDGDIFCHSFKLMELGPLIGKRTWGGVIGIAPRHPLVDGTVTTQPEFSFWFSDVGWRVENYGTDPDIEVDIAPQDYRAGRDPQLDRAVSEALRLLAETPILRPETAGSRPNLSLPKLPPREGLVRVR